MGARKPGPQGERDISRKTIAWGMPDVLRCLRCEYSCAYSYYKAHTRLRVHWAPGIPRALLFSRDVFLAQLGRYLRRGDAESRSPIVMLRFKRGISGTL